jgi:hypothetical protein
MDGFFKDKPVLVPLVRLAIIAFIGLSLINLYYSVKVNRALAEGLKKET